MNTIPLKAVQDALMLAAVKSKAGCIDGKPVACFGAFTQYPDFFDACCRRTRRTANSAPRSNFGPMSRGNLDRTLERVRCEHGLPEVRRTWSAGLRAMKAELADGMLR